MLGLTQLGIVHTAISLVAVGAGFYALARDREIHLGNTVGKVYVVMTVLTCLTGFFIFEHGGFGKPHALGILTLLVLAIAALAGHTSLFGRASRYLETVGYSLTVFFHMIPAFAEGSTRLPPGDPLAATPEDPVVLAMTGVAFGVFLLVATMQVLRLRRARRNQGDRLVTVGAR